MLKVLFESFKEFAHPILNSIAIKSVGKIIYFCIFAHSMDYVCWVWIAVVATVSIISSTV